MSITTCQKVTLISCSVLCVSLFLPRMLLPKEKKDMGQPEGKAAYQIIIHPSPSFSISDVFFVAPAVVVDVASCYSDYRQCSRPWAPLIVHTCSSKYYTMDKGQRTKKKACISHKPFTYGRICLLCGLCEKIERQHMYWFMLICRCSDMFGCINYFLICQDFLVTCCIGYCLNTMLCYLILLHIHPGNTDTDWSALFVVNSVLCKQTKQQHCIQNYKDILDFWDHILFQGNVQA